MADKCAICDATIEIIFLEKIRGTYLKNEKGKRKAVCAVCQKKFSVEELKQKI
jgi:hypothetical protein